MKRTTTKAVRRVAVASTLGLGLVGGLVGIASADSGSNVGSHDSTVTTAPIGKVGGIVVSYVAGTSISILTRGSTVPTSYVLSAATTISGLAVGATAPVAGDNVDLILSSSTPVTVTSITIDAPKGTHKSMKIEGTVLAFVAGTSISVSTKGSTTPTVYTLNAATTITGLGTGVTAPAVGDNVDLTLSTTTPIVVLTVKDEGLTEMKSASSSPRIEGTVSAFVAGTSISVLSKGSTTPTVYMLNAATTITGLGTGVTAPAIGDNVDLILSTTTPIVVLTVKDEASQSGEGHGFGQGDSNRGGSERGHSHHSSWNNNSSSVGSFSNGGFSARGSDHESSRH